MQATADTPLIAEEIVPLDTSLAATPRTFWGSIAGNQETFHLKVPKISSRDTCSIIRAALCPE